jgi:hypothetical protein
MMKLSMIKLVKYFFKIFEILTVFFNLWSFRLKPTQSAYFRQKRRQSSLFCARENFDQRLYNTVVESLSLWGNAIKLFTDVIYECF